MTAQAAIQLREIADHIERVGLNQDGKYFGYKDDDYSIPTIDLPCCVQGAAIALGYSIFEDTWYNPLVRELGYHNVARWNDTTPQAEVLAKLREVADKYDPEFTD